MLFEKVVAPVLLTSQEHEFIQNGVFGVYFPWFVNHQEIVVLSDIDSKIVNRISNPAFFGHQLMDRSTTPGKSGSVTSRHYEVFEDIFLRWCKDNNYPVSVILRAALNISVYNDAEFSLPHRDHQFPCNNWIMYLNSVNAPTLLFDDDYNIIDFIPAEKYQAVAFPSILHAHKFAPVGELRYVVVFTFES
jgi:hypothetical protein